MDKMEYPKPYKKCFVPGCGNSTKNAPNKIFITVPAHKEKRLLWYQAVNLSTTSLPYTKRYCCEDHFDMAEDAVSWVRFKTMGQRISMKPNVVPHKCLTSSEKKPCEESQLSVSEKKQKEDFVQRLTMQSTSTTECPYTSNLVLQDENVIPMPIIVQLINSPLGNNFDHNDSNAGKDNTNILVFKEEEEEEEEVVDVKQEIEFETKPIIQTICSSSEDFFINNITDQENFTKFCSSYKMQEMSDLSHIPLESNTQPSYLLKQWLDEAKNCGAPVSFMNLATSTKNGKVSNRTVLIREIMPDGVSLAFTAEAKSNKIKDINENPQVASTLLLLYSKDGLSISKQVRFQGHAEKLSREQCKIYYDKQNLSSKIRSWICQNCGPANWDELKKEHDKLLKEVVEEGKVLEMPDTQVAYKIVPEEIDFYFAQQGQIADRVLFKKCENNWKFQKIKA